MCVSVCVYVCVYVYVYVCTGAFVCFLMLGCVPVLVLV